MESVFKGFSMGFLWFLGSFLVGFCGVFLRVSTGFSFFLWVF